MDEQDYLKKVIRELNQTPLIPDEKGIERLLKDISRAQKEEKKDDTQ